MMNRILPHARRAHVLPLVLVFALTAGAALARGEDLAARRATQRVQIRTASLRAAQTGAGAPFGLLVIPVDFADARLPVGYQPGRDLGPRLTGTSGETLHHYFDVASGGRCDLRILLAPTIHLPGSRNDYLEGFADSPHTRTLAAIAMGDVAATGFPLRELDMDGPDGVPGTDDDDGWVDGVLLLHAGPGREAGGVIPPHQYYLEEPVVAAGIAASSYAVASLHAGLGIWAHETLHLFGLEERYDPLLPSDAGDSEIHSRGGLGRFSVMAAGAWGTGAGHGCALPDGYSAWQLGWLDAVDLPVGTVADTVRPAVSSRQVARIWTHGEPGAEFFLLEVRDPGAAAPFDADVPGGSLAVYHVDETVPDGWRIVTGNEYHLRARLVEADADEGLREGRDEGSAADLFPGSLGVSDFTAFTVPDSDGYGGPSYVALSGITSVNGGVVFGARAADGPAVRHELAFGPAATPRLELLVVELGEPLVSPSGYLSAAVPTLGRFTGAPGLGTQVEFGLVSAGPGRWRPDREITWTPDPDLPAGSSTRFSLRVTSGTWDSGSASTTWHWDDNTDRFSRFEFTAGGWSQDSPSGDPGPAIWQVWTRLGPGEELAEPIFACTQLAAFDGADWPDVVYGLRAHAVLTSPPLGPGVTGVRLVHAWDSELRPDGAAMDGGAVSWVDADGVEVPAVPVDGWPATISGQSTAVLHGQGAFAGPGELGTQDQPYWCTDVLPVPAHRPGPWRLRFVFASNGRQGDGRRRGWLLARAEPLAGPVPSTAWAVAWSGAALDWDLPAGAADETAAIGILVDGIVAPLAPDLPAPDRTPTGYSMPATHILPRLPAPARTRNLLVLTQAIDLGQLRSRPVVVLGDGGAGASPFVGAPWPNPAPAEVNFTLQVPDGAKARWRIYDMRGRLLREESRAAGTHLVRWDGRDRNGRRAPAGVYFVKVTGTTSERTHKVVLLH